MPIMVRTLVVISIATNIETVTFNLTSIETNVKWNGARAIKSILFFIPEENTTRRYDPISLYLFVMCMDLSHLVMQEAWIKDFGIP
jgi:hypothetical protein